MIPGTERERKVPLLGPLSALGAYVALFLGFMVIGGTTQARDIVSGLWLTEAFVIALPALIVVSAAGILFAPYLGLRWPAAKWFAIAAVTAVLNQPVVSFLTWLAEEVLPHSMVIDFEQNNIAMDGFFRSAPLGMLAAVALSAPVGEEVFFRGFALPAVARPFTKHGALWSALITAIFFSAMHLSKVGALGLFEIGLWLAVLRWGSGSLYPAMLGHALNNAVAGSWFLLGLQSAGREPPEWAVKLGVDNPDAPPPVWVLATGAVLTLVFAWFALRILVRPSPQPPRELERERGPRGADLARAGPLVVLWTLAMSAGLFALLHKP